MSYDPPPMPIERALFLSLTALLAGVACVVESPPPAPPPPAPPPERPEGLKFERACAQDAECHDLAACVCADGTELQMVGCVGGRCLSGWRDCQAMEAFTKQCAAHGGLTAYGFGSVAAAASSAPAAPPPAPHVEAHPTLRPDDPEALSTKKFDPARKNCGDDAPGAVPACATIAVGPCAEGGGPELARKACARGVALFKKGVARRAYACLAKDKKKSCSYGPVSACLHGALMDSCLDPAAEGACAELAGACAGVDQPACMSILSGLSEEGRRALVARLSRHCDYGYMGAIMQEEELAPLPPPPAKESPGF
jgi:hypothetical protein